MPVGDATTLGILAGGSGSRLGGVDKATMTYHGRTLIERTLAFVDDGGFAARLLSHPGADTGAALPLRAIADLRTGRQGPLAGLEALLEQTATPWLLTVPVDLRDVPAGLAARMRDACVDDHVLVVRDADGTQPLVASWPVVITRAAVRTALDAGRRSAQGLLERLRTVELSIAPARLGNLNTPADFA